MYLLAFLAICLAMAVPTLGLSLVVFFVVKNWFDTKAMCSLLGAAVTAMHVRISEERYHINRAAIHKVFSRYSDAPPVVSGLTGKGGETLYWGLLQHPMINNNQIFSVRFGYLPWTGMKSTVYIKASPGIDAAVLSSNDLRAVLFGSLIASDFSYLGHGNEEIIKVLIVQSARDDVGACKCSNLHYGKISELAEKQANGIEWFANYRGMRFWINIGELQYAVYVTPLNPSEEDASGITIEARVSGPAAF